MALRALVVDDEPLARAGIRHLLKRHPDVTVCGECPNGDEAKRAILRHRPDLVFLDLEMPGLSGLDLLRQAPEGGAAPAFIVITAFDEYAAEAFDTQAIDYVLKPVQSVRFDRALARARARLLAARSTAQPSATAAQRDTLVVRSGERTRFVKIEDVDWVEAQDYYVLIHAGQEHHLMRMTLQSLETELNTGPFVRIHRKALVNLTQVVEMRRGHGRWRLRLRDGTWLPVSKSRQADVRKRLGPIR